MTIFSNHSLVRLSLTLLACTIIMTLLVGCIGFQSYTTHGETTSALTIARPDDVAAGDLLLAQIAFTRSHEWDLDVVPTGWTLVHRNEAPANLAQAIYYRHPGANEPDTYTWQFAANVDDPTTPEVAGAIMHYTGVCNKAPIVGVTSLVGEGTELVANELHACDGSRLVAFFTTNHDNPYAIVTTPASMTKRYFHYYQHRSIMAFDENWQGGSTGSRRLTLDTGHQWISHLVALRRPPVLSSLEVNEGVLVPGFISFLTTYAVEVATDVTEMTVTATPQNITAQVFINGLAGSPQTVSLDVGANPVYVVVRDPDSGSERTYTVTVNRAAADPPEEEPRKRTPPWQLIFADTIPGGVVELPPGVAPAGLGLGDFVLRTAQQTQIPVPKSITVYVGPDYDGVHSVQVPGRIMFPLRYVSGGFGATVTWDEKSQQATITLGDKQAVITVGSGQVYVDGRVRVWDLPAELHNGHVYVTGRMLTELHRLMITWGPDYTATFWR